MVDVMKVAHRVACCVLVCVCVSVYLLPTYITAIHNSEDKHFDPDNNRQADGVSCVFARELRVDILWSFCICFFGHCDPFRNLFGCCEDGAVDITRNENVGPPPRKKSRLSKRD